MNTKTFAQKARNILMHGVAKKLLYWGFDTDGKVLESPEAISGGYRFRGDVYDDPNVPELYKSLKNAVNKKGIEVVVEEAAYTWFNRIMAIRIMAKNGYDLPQLEYAEGLKHTPVILQKARQGQYSFLNDAEKSRLQRIVGDYNKENETFALLLIGYCHSHNTLNKVFGRIDDYTELLLPDDMLKEQGFLNLLNTTDAISDEEYREVELIGWLYQFYISERKDEVFAAFKKKKKAEAKDIPAATQIFTPKWIVKYMVENTAGKIWLDHHPTSSLKGQMKYLVENEADQDRESIIGNVEELTLMDPACGSGHILVEGFELLYKMYLEEFYTPEEAVQTILEKNLYGLDIDDRAAQLANFAVLLKAAKVYPDVWEKNWQPNIYAMPEANGFSRQEILDFLGEERQDYLQELEKALQLLQQAKNLGSVIKIELSEKCRSFIEQRFNTLKNDGYLSINLKIIVEKVNRYIPFLLLLTRKYTSLIANPPYMGKKNMNSILKNYLEESYPKSSNDLMTVFIERLNFLTEENGCFSCITIPTWMYSKTFIDFRFEFLKRSSIDSLLDMGRGVFGSDFGSVAFSAFKSGDIRIGSYFQLFDKFSLVRPNKKIEKLFLTKYNLFKSNSKRFLNIDGNRLAYWLSDRLVKKFSDLDYVDSHINVKKGMSTANDSLYLRNWYEVSKNNTSIFNNSIETKWFPITKGGSFRKWYGNNEYVVNWENNGNDIKQNPKSYIRSESYYFKESLTYGYITVSKISFRYIPEGFLSTAAGPILNGGDLLYFLAYLNTPVASALIRVNSGNKVTFEVGEIQKTKTKLVDNSAIKEISKNSISISKKDWDSREISWDFQRNPLVVFQNTLKQSFNSWKEQVRKDFFQLHQNEEKLNHIFIENFDFQDDLNRRVPLQDISVLQNELKSKELKALELKFRAEGAEAITLPIDRAEVMQQFISYTIGLFMGRYRLDKPGLNIAQPNPSKEELAPYHFNNGEVTIDEDAIVPLMGKKANFKDDALYQIQNLLDTIWGHENRTENLNFLQECLNKDLEKYLVKDFWKYHCKMYNKKPIYWLFASKKGAFQVLAYMHRMNAFTVEKIRANYLLEHLKFLNSEIHAMEKDESSLTTQQARKLDQMRKDLAECEEYDMSLKDMADKQIKFDLDDGVTENYKLFDGVVAKIK